MSDPGRNRMHQNCWDTSGSKRYSGFDLLHRFAANEWRKQVVLNKDGVEFMCRLHYATNQTNAVTTNISVRSRIT